MKLRLVMLVPLLIVNAIAITGQYLFWKSHLPQFPAIAALGFALALESIAVYISLHAHLAELSQDSSFRLRFSSYAAGIIIGLLNGSHFTVNGKITAASVGMFILSASSPVLWAIHTRRQSRDDLKSKGLIEDRAVKLGAMRWILWPGRSFPVFRQAVWNGENNPSTAIKQWNDGRHQKAQEQAQEQASDPRKILETTTSQADAVRIALRESGLSTASDVGRWLYDRGIKGVSPAYIRQIRASDARKTAQEQRDTIRALPSGETQRLTSSNGNYRHSQ